MVIETYSVIIQNQKTLESFSQYQPLFVEAVKSGRIGICKWIESGTTIDTALPELASLTNDKQEWRAIIVRYEDDERMAAFPSDPRNPYDFLINKDKDEWEGESPIPLVRLTQMLGGVPRLEVRFKTEIVREDHKAPRTVYVPIEDERREQAYRKLVRKYRFDGKMPASILIVTVRNSHYQEEDSFSETWKAHRESDSSAFWKRNDFPSVCRFLTYTFQDQGPIQREADNFGFWYTIMLLSINEWDPSTMQAYRLYELDVVMDRPAMTEAFQRLADRLRDAKHSLERSIRQDVENEICEEEELPEYRIEVPVPIKRPRMEECLPKIKTFQLLPRGVAADGARWSRQCQRAEDMLAASVRSAERMLDQTADKMRGSCTFAEGDITPLNKYQEEDIQQELEDFYHTIVTIQGKLPNETIHPGSELEGAEFAVHEYLLKRVTKRPAILTAVLAVVLLALAAVPAAMDCFARKGGTAAAIAAVTLGYGVCVVLAALAVLMYQKMKLDTLVIKYIRHLKDAFKQLTEQTEDYSVYMSSIGSHQRGSSYLNLSRRQKHRSSMEHGTKYRHITAINHLLGRLRKWSKAYRLDVDFSSARPEAQVDVDTTVTPAENKIYAFDAQAAYSVAINSSGMTMESPYAFASRIEIIREELYDDE